MFAAIKECQIPGQVEFAIDHTGINERRIGKSQVCTLIARVLSKRRTNYMQKVVSGVRRGRNRKLDSLGRRRCAHHGHDGRCAAPARDRRKGQGERGGAQRAGAGGGARAGEGAWWVGSRSRSAIGLHNGPRNRHASPPSLFCAARAGVQRCCC